MSRRAIEIRCPAWRLDRNVENQQRLAACRRFQRTDRAPVVVLLTLPYLFWARGVQPADFFASPRAHLEGQILSHKWIIENIFDDRVIGSSITVGPDFGTARGGSLAVDVRLASDGSTVTRPHLATPKEVEALEVPDVKDNLSGKKIEWHLAMKELASDYDVTLNGTPMPVHVGLSAVGGPFPDAYAVAGQNIFLWMYEAPKVAHRLMHIATTAFLDFARHVRMLAGAPAENLHLGADGAEMLSPTLFREFVLPYYLECYQAFPGERGLHMCGQIDHLIPILTQEMKISHLNGFGSVTNPELVAEWMGGRVVVSGGIDPWLLLQGPRQDIRRECHRYLQIFAPHGAYILGDGCGVCPGTDPDRVALMVEASQEYSSV